MPPPVGPPAAGHPIGRATTQRVMRQRAPRRPPPSRARSARDGSVALVREGGRGRGRGRAVALGDNFEDIPGYVGARCRRASGCGRAWRQFRGHTRLCGCAVSSGVGLRSRCGDNFEDIPGYVGARRRRASGCGRAWRQFRGHTRLCGCAVSSGVGLRSRLATISRTYPVMWVRGVVGRRVAVALGDNFEDIPGYVGGAVSSGVGLPGRAARDNSSRTYPVMWVRGVVGRRVAVALGDNFEDIPGYVGARCRRASGCGRAWRQFRGHTRLCGCAASSGVGLRSRGRQFRGHTRLCGCAASSGVGLRSRLATISRTYPVMWVRGVVGRRVAVALGDNFEDIPGYVGARRRRASGCGRAWRQFRGHTRLCGCAVSSGVGLRSRLATISRTYPVMWVRGVVGRRVAVALGDNFEDIPGYVGCAVSSRVALRSRRRAKTPLRGGPGRARSGRVWGPGGARSREAASTAPCGSAVRRGGQPKALQRSFGFAVDELPYSGPSGSPWTNCPTAVLRVRRGRTGARTGRCTPGLLPWCRRRSGGRGTSCRRDR